MDIFPLDNAAKTHLGRKFQFLCSKVVIAKALDRRGYDTDTILSTTKYPIPRSRANEISASVLLLP